jgi:hypothetical protein
MSNENEQNQQAETTTTTTNETSTDAGAELGDVLGGGDEAGFVSGETKKPLSTGTFVMAGFLLACAGATYFMYHRNATASVAATPESAAAQSTITQFLSDDKDNVNKMKDLLHNTEKAVEQFKASPVKTQVPVGDLQTNPFRLADEKPDGAEVPLDKLAAEKKAAEEKAATLKAAQTLNVQFVMSGGKRKSCMINNAVYREGQTVGGFTVESINPGAVIVRKGETRFELKMKK